MRGNESVYLFRLTITLHSTQVMDRNDVLAFTKKGNDSYIPDTFLELGKKIFKHINADRNYSSSF